MVVRKQDLRTWTAPLLRPLHRLISRWRVPAQLSLELVPPPTTAAELRVRLVRLGLSPELTVRLTDNSSVVVSFSRKELRIHRGYLKAPESTWRAIVTFVSARSRSARLAARRDIVAFPLSRDRRPGRRETPRRRMHPDDVPLAGRLRAEHARYNTEHFGGLLAEVPIFISRRMRRRLGHYTHRDSSGGSDIVISRRHIRRDGWDEALQTLLHEMVHQWQDESGRPVDHGREFRKMARRVGIQPRAGREID